MENGGGAACEQTRELVFGRETLSCSDRHPGSTRDAGHLLGHFGRCGFLEPERIVGLQARCESESTRRCELPVGSEEEVGPGAHRLPQSSEEELRSLQGLERRLSGIEDTVGTSGVELQGGEPHVEVLGCPLRREVRIDVDVGFVARTGVEVGVGA